MQPIMLVSTHWSKGGAERQMRLLAEHLALPDAPVVHVVLAGELPGALPETPGLRRLSLQLTSFRSWKSLLCFRSACKRFSPRVILSCVTVCDAFAMSWNWTHGIPWIMREPSSYAGRPRDANVRLRSWLGRRASGVVANSEGGRRYWDARRPQRTALIPNILDVDALHTQARVPLPDLKLPPHFFLGLGRLESPKQWNWAIHAIALLKQDGIDRHLVVAGAGDLGEQLRGLAQELNVANQIHFLGHVENPIPLIQRADALLSTSVYEGLPNAAMEGLALQCPLLLSAIPAHTDVFSERTATFFPLDSPLSLANQLRKLKPGHREPADDEYTTEREHLLERWRPQSVATAYRDLIATWTSGADR